MKTYPNVTNDTIDTILTVIKKMVQLRNYEDVSDFDNLNQKFILGRKTYRVPSSSSDVLATDREGDFCVTATFLYILFNNSGTLVWRRTAITSF